MSHVAYVNGRYVPHRQASVHVEDRGYQFADGVYEVIFVADGVFVDEDAHLDRYGRSLSELRMAWPLGRAALRVVLREVVRRNRLWNGFVYWQTTRGVAPRNHPFPPADTPTSLVVTAKRAPALTGDAPNGARVVTVPDIRWGRCDIKSVSLLPNVLAKQAAKDSGAFEAWMVDRDGNVTEGSSTNAWIITFDGEIRTRVADNHILPGITRKAVIALAEREGLRFVETGFTLEEAKSAKEAFLTSSTNHVLPVVQIDDTPVANGHPGELTLKLRELYREASAGGGILAQAAE